MNKKEVAEIKKNFALENGFFTIERILTAFVDAEDNILYSADKTKIIEAPHYGYI